jgi:hypothetical protein
MMKNLMFARSQKPAVGPVIKRVLVRCPSTGKLSPTGQTVDEALWPKAKFKRPSPNCPHCHRGHSWKKEDVILAR